MISPDLTNVVWIKTILTNMIIPKSNRHIRPKKVKYPIPEIPDDSGKKSGTDWVLPKMIGYCMENHLELRSKRVKHVRKMSILIFLIQTVYFFVAKCATLSSRLVSIGTQSQNMYGFGNA